MALTAATAPARATSLDDLRFRWRQTLVGGANLDSTIPEVRSALSSVQSGANRNWTSLDKTSNRANLWSDIARTTVSADVSSNYTRIRVMALGWATPGQNLYQDAGLLADIISAMDWMDANRYNPGVAQYDNWWDWQIGSPALVMDVVILLYDQLTPAQLTRYLTAVHAFDSDPSTITVTRVEPATGANLSDRCKIALLHGIVTNDPAEVSNAVQALSPVFAYVTTLDGFYIDGSFIQHNHHPYTGSYGLVLLGDIAELLYLLTGSPWDVTDPNRSNVTQWVTESFAPLLYEGAMMDMVRGRAISRSSSPDHTVGHSVIAALLRLSQVGAPADSAAMVQTIKRWLSDDTSTGYANSLPLDLIGLAHSILGDNSITPADLPVSSRIYGSVDRAVHLRPAWAAGIAMHSTRIYNFENINGENLKAWHTGDGMLYLYNSDLKQFDGSFWPTVDPQRLPGTTVVSGSTPRQSQLGGSNAVGGASLDGYSAVMMQLNPDRRQLQAKKSLFLFDDEIVALGADIRSTAPAAVETIVENRQSSADAVFTSDPGGAWASLSTGGSQIGYFFPDSTTPWKTVNGSRMGAWRDINNGGSTTVLTAAFQTIWFDHGPTPAGASYSYMLLPGMDATGAAAYAASPGAQIVQNDAIAQAVAHAGLGILAVNFWSDGGTVVGPLSSDRIASVVVHQTPGGVNIAVADPTQANRDSINIELAPPAGGWPGALSVGATDNGVTVVQTSPTLQMMVNVAGSAGKVFRANLSFGN